MYKKAQAAMEFLMTYGWAILVVLVVIGALGYFGVLNPMALLPEKCVFGSEIVCRDWMLKSNVVSLNLQNNLGETMTITSIKVLKDDKVTLLCSLTSITNTDVNANNPQKLLTGQTGKYVIGVPNTGTIGTCDFGVSGQKTKLYLSVLYKKGTSTLEHPIEGEVFAQVQV